MTESLVSDGLAETTSNGLSETSQAARPSQTNDGAPPVPEPTVPAHITAAKALRDHLWDEFFEQAERELPRLKLSIRSSEENDKNDRWDFSFDDVKEVDGRAVINLKVKKKRDSKAYRLPLEISLRTKPSEKEDLCWLQFGVRRKGRSKYFKFLSVQESEGDLVIGPTSGRLTPNYANRNVSENVKEIWFPGDESKKKASLEVPLQLEFHVASDSGESRTRPAYWPIFSDEGIEIRLPEVSLESQATEGEESSTSFSIEGADTATFGAGFSLTIFWLISNIYGGKQGSLHDKEWDDSDVTIGEVFPDAQEYQATRPIDLQPAEVITGLKNEGFHFPWHVVESACASLNAGKNVIFTGPPGCGKSKLAAFLAEKGTGHPALMATASPAWTAGDLIGRYLPAKSDRGGLVFREGFFLRALGRSDDGDGTSQPSRWLIIDEFNRADIDGCFGELFSVFAGDVVELSLQKTVQVEDESDDIRHEERFVRIIQDDEDAESDADYRVPRRFRLIGTMNDADRSGLNDLSFALMRRFAIIPVEPPEPSVLCKIVEDTIQDTNKALKLDSESNRHSWMVGQKENKSGSCTLQSIEDELRRLFANQGEKSLEYWIEKKQERLSPTRPQTDIDENFQDLIAERVVGVSAVKDIINFVGEGLRAGTDAGSQILVDYEPVKDPNTSAQPNLQNLAEHLTLSYLAMAVVLQVFPQLEALAIGSERGENQLFSAIWHIFWSFHTDTKDGEVTPRQPEKLLMLRVTRNENDDGFELQSDQTLSEFLFKHLLTRFPHISARHLRDHLGPWLPAEET